MKKILVFLIAILSALILVSTTTAGSVTYANVINNEKNNEIEISNLTSVDYDISKHVTQMQNILKVDDEKIKSLYDKDIEQEDFLISLLSFLKNGNYEENIENLFNEIEQEYDSSEVEALYATIEDYYDEDYIQGLLPSIDKAFNENDFDELAVTAGNLENNMDLTSLVESLRSSNNEDEKKLVETYDLLTDEEKLNNLITTVSEDPSSAETIGIGEFWFAFIIYWVLFIDSYFSVVHPLIYNTFPPIVFFFPMTYVLIIPAFFKTLSDYFVKKSTSPRTTPLLDRLNLRLSQLNIFTNDRMLKIFERNKTRLYEWFFSKPSQVTDV